MQRTFAFVSPIATSLQRFSLLSLRSAGARCPQVRSERRQVTFIHAPSRSFVSADADFDAPASAGPTRIYVGNVPWRCSPEELESFLREEGNLSSVSGVSIPVDNETGRPRGFAFLEVDPSEVDALLNMTGAELGGRPLTLRIANPRQPRENRRYGDREGRPSRPRRDFDGPRRDYSSPRREYDNYSSRRGGDDM
mmetsp:Transcript_6388/g.11043  ORF Transcript_6388/g.11043 Transcript_6388/m.11043 type:complete len:195 (+) Transcript_6388:93-677(+)